MNWGKGWKAPIWFRRKMKISKISEFSILPYTQNRKFGNIGYFFLLQIFAVVETQDLKKTKKKWTETKTESLIAWLQLSDAFVYQEFL